MWVVVMATVAVMGLVVIPAGMAVLFRPQRARNVKHYEIEMLEHVVEVRRYHPEIVKVPRLDRHPAFITPHVCVLGYSICVFSGAQLTSNVLTLGDQARYTMATCFLVGSILVLTGSALGLRVGSKHVGVGIHDHLTASILGDDVVLPYRLAMAGMGAMVVSSTIYAWTSFQSTTGSLGGWLTGGMAAWCLTCIVTFSKALSVFRRQDALLISEAQARIEADDELD